MSSVEGLRSVTMDTVPIDIQLENMPKPIRITGFDLNKKNNFTIIESKKIFCPTPNETYKKKVE